MSRIQGIYLRRKKQADYYINSLPGKEQELADYVSVMIPAHQTEAGQELQRRGFRFVDRGVVLQISLRDFKPMLSPGEEFTFDDRFYYERVCRLAETAFDGDARFALDPEDTELKNELLRGYIFNLRYKKASVTCMYRDRQLEGFTIWNIQDGVGRILLGAVSEHYRGSGVAASLYMQTLTQMQARGAHTLRCVVLGSNTAAMNLYALLIRGAGGVMRFGGCRDYYALCPRDKERNKLPKSPW